MEIQGSCLWFQNCMTLLLQLGHCQKCLDGRKRTGLKGWAGMAGWAGKESALTNVGGWVLVALNRTQAEKEWRSHLLINSEVGMEDKSSWWIKWMSQEERMLSREVIR